MGDSYVPEGLMGVEVRQGDTVLFRGGWDPDPDMTWFSLYDESGNELSGLSFSATMGDGTMIGPDGEIITPREQHEPTAAGLLRVALAPELVHRGSWRIYALVTLLAAAGMGYILFYRELFYWGSGLYRQRPGECGAIRLVCVQLSAGHGHHHRRGAGAVCGAGLQHF